MTIKKKLLIVDDELADGLARALMAQLVDVDIITARTKREGIEKALQEKPAVVSLDNYMPSDETSARIAPYGTEIARAIKTALPQTYIVGLSSAPESLQKEYFDCILHKGTDMERYADTVREYLGKAQKISKK